MGQLNPRVPEVAALFFIGGCLMTLIAVQPAKQREHRRNSEMSEIEWNLRQNAAQFAWLVRGVRLEVELSKCPDRSRLSAEIERRYEAARQSESDILNRSPMQEVAEWSIQEPLWEVMASETQEDLTLNGANQIEMERRFGEILDCYRKLIDERTTLLRELNGLRAQRGGLPFLSQNYTHCTSLFGVAE